MTWCRSHGIRLKTRRKTLRSSFPLLKMTSLNILKASYLSFRRLMDVSHYSRSLHKVSKKLIIQFSDIRARKEFVGFTFYVELICW